MQLFLSPASERPSLISHRNCNVSAPHRCADNRITNEETHHQEATLCLPPLTHSVFVATQQVLTPADEVHHIRKVQYGVPFVCGAKNLGEALRRIAEGAAMIRLKGNAGTGNVMHAVRHARAVFAEIRQLVSMDEDEVYVFAKEHQSPLELVRLTRALGRLPVTTFAAGGIATPADVMLLMSMGCDGVFVGSGIFKGANSPQRARAMVEACTYWRRPEIVAQVSAGLGKAMVGILDNGETYNYVADSVL